MYRLEIQREHGFDFLQIVDEVRRVLEKTKVIAEDQGSLLLSEKIGSLSFYGSAVSLR